MFGERPGVKELIDKLLTDEKEKAAFLVSDYSKRKDVKEIMQVRDSVVNRFIDQGKLDLAHMLFICNPAWLKKTRGYFDHKDNKAGLEEERKFLIGECLNLFVIEKALIAKGFRVTGLEYVADMQFTGKRHSSPFNYKNQPETDLAYDNSARQGYSYRKLCVNLRFDDKSVDPNIPYVQACLVANVEKDFADRPRYNQEGLPVYYFSLLFYVNDPNKKNDEVREYSSELFSDSSSLHGILETINGKKLRQLVMSEKQKLEDYLKESR